MFIRAAGQVAPVKINAEKEGVSVAKQYNVHGYPTILFIDPNDGKVVSKIVGYMPAQPFADEISLANGIAHDLTRVTKAVQKNPSDAADTERLALFDSKLGKLEDSAALIEKAEQLDPNGSKGPLASACWQLASAYSDANKNAEAEKYYEKTLQYTHDPFQVVDSNLSLAQIYYADKDKDKANSELNKVIADPNTPDYLQKIAKAMQKQLNR